MLDGTIYICMINSVLLFRVESTLTYIICFVFQAHALQDS
jgi:hypothetical protein